jgi:two-component system NtrC family sensor kinase
MAEEAPKGGAGGRSGSGSGRRPRAPSSQGPGGNPAPDALLAAQLRLHRELRVEDGERRILERALVAFEELLPRRWVAVCVLPPDGGPPALHRAPSAPPPRDVALRITRSAVEDLGLGVPENALPVVERYEPLLEGAGGGFDVPLIAGPRIFGVLHVEAPTALEATPADRSRVLPLALQLATALRNARLWREADVRRSNLLRLLDQAAAPIAVIGPELRLRMVNRVLLAGGRRRVEGELLSSLLPESQRRHVEPPLRRAFAGHPQTGVEVRIPHRDRPPSRLTFNLTPVRDGLGAVEAVVALGRDLTRQTALEAQVLHAERLATVGQIAAGVVHELNNPLTSISVYGQFLLRRGEGAGFAESDLEKLRRITDSTERILRFSRDLVAYARPPSGHLESVGIAPVVRQALTFCEHVLQEAGAVLTADLPEDAVTIRGVRHQLQQIVVNLVTNAAQATDRGGEVRVAVAEDDDETILLSVEDSGVGVPTDLRARIFEPFFSTKAEGRGTGLGLSIVENLVTRHGGTIRVEDGATGGARFEVRLPRG